MDIYLINGDVFLEEIQIVLVEHFGLSEDAASILTMQKILPHIKQLRSNLNFLIETEYIDKVYRDSYYNYYSTKLNEYKRSCLKVSIFDCDLEYDFFRDKSTVVKLKENFLGFFVLRPTEPNIIGRSIISPKALVTNNFQTCIAFIPTTVLSIKFDVRGFPHSSQDAETITCAETALWAIFEYFGNKYSEYKPILPSQILGKLKNISHERQMPSKGLLIHQMSYVLREFGLEPKIYSRSEYNHDFEKLISMYIESGIPLIIALDNLKYITNPGFSDATRYIGHASLCIGREMICDEMIDNLTTLNSPYSNLNDSILENELSIFDLDDIRKKFIFIDDNMPVYQNAFLDHPCDHYSSADWSKCEISYFIAPLHKKVYLEAYEVKNFALALLLSGNFSINKKSNFTIKAFLTSCRSYKQYIAFNELLVAEAKDEILEQKMPKFIWVIELSTKELSKQGLVNGLLIIDATEPNLYNIEPLILGMYNNIVLKYSNLLKNLERIPLSLQPFRQFDSNLK